MLSSSMLHTLAAFWQDTKGPNKQSMHNKCIIIIIITPVSSAQTGETFGFLRIYLKLELEYLSVWTNPCLAL